MTLIAIMVTLVIVGVILWAVNTYIPMALSIRKILNIVTILIVCLWLLQVFGIIGSIWNVNVGNIHVN